LRNLAPAAGDGRARRADDLLGLLRRIAGPAGQGPVGGRRGARAGARRRRARRGGAGLAGRPLGAVLSDSRMPDDAGDDLGSGTPAARPRPAVLAPSELGPDDLRRALGRFVTGVTIVT